MIFHLLSALSFFAFETQLGKEYTILLHDKKVPCRPVHGGRGMGSSLTLCWPPFGPAAAAAFALSSSMFSFTNLLTVVPPLYGGFALLAAGEAAPDPVDALQEQEQSQREAPRCGSRACCLR